MIEIQNLRKDYPGFELNLEEMKIDEGTITGLVGVNGSGKSTTFKLLCGLVKPDSGNAKVLGASIDSLPVSVKEQMGVVFNDSGFPGIFSMKDIKAVLKNMYSGFDPELFDQLCRKLDLDMNKKLQKMSTGMQVRAKLTAALSHNPKLLILDEPTAGLDIIARHQIYELLQTYMETPGRSILISSHIASDLESLCDDFWMIHKGKLVLHETVDDLQNQFGLLNLTEKQYEDLDKSAVRGMRKTPGGLQVLVEDRQFYEENYPGLVIEKGNLDDLIQVLEEGETK